jgi:DNA-binding NtrC family response regulator
MDHSEIQRQYLERQMTNWGCTVQSASNITEAVDLITQSHVPFNIFLIDGDICMENFTTIVDTLYRDARNMETVVLKAVLTPGTSIDTMR